MDADSKCSCGQLVYGHRYEDTRSWKEPKETQMMRNEPHTQFIRDCRKNPDKLKDPFRSFAISGGDPDGFIYLTIKDPKAKDGRGYLIHQCNLCPEGFQDDSSRRDLENIFAFLHKYLIKQERNKMSANEIVLSAADLVDQAVDDKRTLLKCVYALGNGVRLSDTLLQTIKDEEKGFEKPAFMGAYAATDIIFRLQQKNPCPLQRCIAETAWAMTGNKQLIELLSFFRIGTSTKPIVNAVNSSWNKLPPMKLKPRDYHVASLDNLGFHDKKNVKYDEWVVFLLQVVKEAKQKELGFYQSSPDKRISRTRKTIGDFIVQAGGQNGTATERTTKAAHALVGVKADDYAKESFYNLRQLEYCIETTLPTYNECKDRLGRKSFKTNFKIARNLGFDVSERGKCCKKNRVVQSQPPMKYRGNAMATPVAATKFASIIDTNDYVLDTPVHDSLSKTETVVDLMNTSLRHATRLSIKTTKSIQWLEMSRPFKTSTTHLQKMALQSIQH